MAFHWNGEESFSHEAILIAACGRFPSKFDEIASCVDASCFERDSLSKMFSVATQLSSNGELSTAKLFHRSMQTKAFENEPDVRAIREYITNQQVNVELVTDYALKVRDLFLRRKAAAAAQEIYDLSLSDDFSTEKVVEIAQKSVPSDEREAEDFKDFMLEYFEQKMSGVVEESPTIGLSKIDNWMRGIGYNRLIILAARPGTGKTALALHILRHISFNSEKFGHPVFFSLEMGKPELIDRMVASSAGVNCNALMRNDLNEEQRERIIKPINMIRNMDMTIDDRAKVTVDYIKRRCRALKKKHGKLGVIMIDYLGLMDIQLKKGEMSHEAIGRITRELKIFTKEIGCSIILLAQLNRSSERENRAPIMADLRGSGSIEQDADMIFFLHDLEDESDNTTTKVKFIVAKGRQTGINEFRLDFIKPIQRMRESFD